MTGGDNGNTGSPTKVLFCGDREVGARIVSHIVDQGGLVVGVGVNSPPSPFSQVIVDASGVDPSLVYHGRSMASGVALRKLGAEAPDLGVSCGFAAILPPELLALPRWGWVNVHRSYLPYNRGLDPLQWAVIDGTPAGVSVHVMTDRIDAGPIVAQAEMPVLPTDDGDALEARADALAFDLFRGCWPRLRAGDLSGTPQDEDLATYHSLADCAALRHLDRAATMKVGRLLDILRCYSGSTYSAVDFGVGLLRTRFTVHTHIRIAGEPAGTGGSPTSADERVTAAPQMQRFPSSEGELERVGSEADLPARDKTSRGTNT